ncbi:hypothetical protein N7451_012346 [Penicillium sp. IBT 35674x]|nr:hypothetical protein N7451_012346 [Penicillium sp. IBT 35674x]
MAGPSYDESTHQIFTVTNQEAFFIDGAHMSIQLHIRIRDFEGLPSESPKTSIYFDHERHLRDIYSIASSLIPKKIINSKGLVWGNDFDHPIRDQLPVGFNIAYKIAETFIDPGIDCDAYSNRPWFYGPALSCFVVSSWRASTKVSNSGWPQRSPETISTPAERSVVEEGGDVLKLPGIKIKVLKYVSERTHTLRYVFKDRHNGEVYLAVVFKLLFKEELANLASEP